MPSPVADLHRVRASLDEARRTGWREIDHAVAEMEEYVSAVRASRRGARILTSGEARTTVTA